MGKAQYARHAVDTYDAPWLAELPWATRMVWTPLVLSMKKSGGVLVNMTPEKFAVLIDAPGKNVKEFVKAAATKGSLVIEGRDWYLKNYDEWQTDKTVNDRMRAYRDRQRQALETHEAPVTEPLHSDGVTRNGSVTDRNGYGEVTPPYKRETRNEKAIDQAAGANVDPPGDAPSLAWDLLNELRRVPGVERCTGVPWSRQAESIAAFVGLHPSVDEPTWRSIAQAIADNKLANAPGLAVNGEHSESARAIFERDVPHEFRRRGLDRRGERAARPEGVVSGNRAVILPVGYVDPLVERG